MSCPRHEDLLRLFVETNASAPPSGEWEQHLATCTDCRASWSRLDGLRAAIGAPRDEFEEPALKEEIITRLRLQASRPAAPARRWSWPWLLIPTLVPAAAALLLFVRPLSFEELVARDPLVADSQFSARGSAALDPDRWVALQVFRARPHATGYERVAGDIDVDDALLFAYANRPPSPYRNLMIVAVSERGELFWYHPEYTEASADPLSRSIESSSEPRDLMEAISHALPAGWLRVFGLFLEQPMRVKEAEAVIERALAQHPDITTLGRLPIPHSGQHSFLLRVHEPGKKP